MSDQNRKRYNRFKILLGIDEKKRLVSETYLNAAGKEDWHGMSTHGAVPGTEGDYYLPKGLIIIRYGDEGGQYAAPVGTAYTELAMPYQIRSLEYNEYIVVKDKAVPAIPVLKGKVAKQPSWPDERGGGVQFYFPDRFKPVGHYVGRGLRRLEVSKWSKIIDEDIGHK